MTSEQIYEELAELYERGRQPDQRDAFLVLAADAALGAGRHDHAERLRARLLQLSPYHELRLFPSFQDALRAGEVRSYLVDLRRQFPPEEAHKLIQKVRDSLPPASANHAGANATGVDHSAPLAPPKQSPRPSPQAASRSVRLPGEQSEYRWLIDLLIAITVLGGVGLLAFALLRPLLGS